MKNNVSVNDILEIEATCDLLLKMCRKARLKLQPVSTGGNQKKKVLSAEVTAKVLTRRQKTITKQTLQAV